MAEFHKLVTTRDCRDNGMGLSPADSDKTAFNACGVSRLSIEL